MHSSRMRTGRALTVSGGGCLPGAGGACQGGGCVPGGGACQGGCLPGGGACQGGWCLPGGVPARGGACQGGVPARGGCLTSPPHPVDRITDTCKNITLAKTSFRPVTRYTLMCVDLTFSPS